ncbi:transport protein RbsD/FucU [Neobacillus bataviensis LMG 21833]|uniref:Transport protein RbsD/FucU n=1 Tax=Neobacillus bataviensis LMG 21833 TaxID=1117379 RepID=K6CYG7_9BACI|nr:RbsD/FucU domain-containing protein [Neobacillus bataviensis]EKN65277.1 transport protein RbsD/FucU [Neobacillus bataviensis LMG 21833]
MLKGIPPIISPDLMKILMEMGHGDEIVLADGNFPAASHAARLINGNGHGVPEFLTAILQFFPLDTYVKSPVMLMNPVEGDEEPVIWQEYDEIVTKMSSCPIQIEKLERMDFYERSKAAYAILATSERVPYGNIILKKGVL